MQKEEHYMESILYVGMDVHTSNYTLCTYSIEDDREFGLVKFEPDYHAIYPAAIWRDIPVIP